MKLLKIVFLSCLMINHCYANNINNIKESIQQSELQSFMNDYGLKKMIVAQPCETCYDSFKYIFYGLDKNYSITIEKSDKIDKNMFFFTIENKENLIIQENKKEHNNDEEYQALQKNLYSLNDSLKNKKLKEKYIYFINNLVNKFRLNLTPIE